MRVTDSVFVQRTQDEHYLFIFAIDDENYRYCFALVPGPECPIVISGFKKAFKNSAYQWGEKLKNWHLLQSNRDYKVLCCCLVEAVAEYWSQDNVSRPVKVMSVT